LKDLFRIIQAEQKMCANSVYQSLNANDSVQNKKTKVEIEEVWSSHMKSSVDSISQHQQVFGAPAPNDVQSSGK
jgi:hypothetical protein